MTSTIRWSVLVGLLVLLPAGHVAACTTNQDCEDGNLCTSDACNVATGTCTSDDNTLPCNDFNLCTVQDTCSGGICVGGAPRDCDDGNPCTDDICDSGLGCLYASNSVGCTDGNACTTNDVCNGEVCVGGNKASGCTACQAVADIPAQGGTFVGTTSGTSSQAGSCANSGTSPERVYRWTPSSSGQAVLQTCGTGTNYDTIVYLRQSNCQTGTEVACNDDTTGCGVADGTTNADHHGSRIAPTVTAGETYYVVVDGYNGKAGTYTLTVTPPTICGNNVREGVEQCDGTQVGNCVSGQCSAQCTCVPPPNGLPDMTPEISSVSVVFGTSVAAGDVAEGCAESTSGVDLMRFTVRSTNVGSADLFLGDPGCPSPCTDHPLEVCANPQYVCSPAEGHNHAHYDNYARYDLLDQSGQTLVVGHKQGFCLRDSSSCATAKYTCANQGITAGCSDVYASTLGCQYLDITGVPSGGYTLRVGLDPFGRVPELSETNNVTTVAVTIPPRASTTTSTVVVPTTTSTTIASPGTCASPTVLPAAGGTFTGTTTGTSALAGTCANSGTSPEKVFQWTPTASGTATIRTCSTATNYDTVVYMRQASCGSGTQVACNDDTAGCAVADGTTNADHHGSVITPAVTAGQTYFIVVDGYNGKKGNFSLTIVAPAAATTTTTVATPTTSSTSTTATTSSTSTTATASSTSTSSTASIPSTSSTTSTTATTSTTSTTSTTATTSTTSTVPASCAAPAVIAPEGGTITGTTSGSTSSLAGTCANTATSPEKVFQWTPPRSGTATIRTCGTSTTFDTVLYVRGGTCTGSQLACNDDTTGCGVSDGTGNSHRHGSVVSPTVTAGQTYFIVVDGYKGKNGNFGLTVIPPQ